MKKYIVTFLIALVGGVVAIAAYEYFNKDNANTNFGTGNTTVSNMPVALPESDNSVSFVRVAEIATPTVVHITTSSTATRYVDPFREFFGYKDKGYTIPQMATGSGVIISADGYIATNNHVVEMAEKIEVVLNDKRSYFAKVVGTDPSSDLALLKIDAKNLPFISFGNSDEVKVGEWVLAVGNPFNLTSTVTAGIISAKARNINLLGGGSSIESFLQTDAAVNPGNSGGALVNMRGQLIGINTAIASRTGTFTGYSFAVPSNIITKVTNDLKEFGVVQRGFIGVNITDVTAKLAEEKNLKMVSGAYVISLTEGGAASKAGIKEGDVIVAVNGIPIGSTPELQEQVGRYRPGDEIRVAVKRGNKDLNLEVVLRNAEGKTALLEKKESRSFEALGAQFENLSDAEKNKFGIRSGVKITKLEPNGKLARIGIKPGFVITNIEDKEINSIEEIDRSLSYSSGSVLIEGFYPGSSTRYKYGFSL